MKQLTYIILLILTIDFLIPSCANPRAPTGGEKDTIPPNLINTYPAIGTINFEGREISLEFNERISDDKLKANIIITPQLDLKFKSIVKKNRLYLKFEEDFPDSTTVTLNFFDGITDITENNPAVNLSYVFSTGPFLDSLSISGNVSDMYTDEVKEKFIVGIYPVTDTLDQFKEKPTYFTTTDELGNFSIQNIKNNTYKLLTFNDANRNLLFEGSSESFGFKSGNIVLDSSIQNIYLKTLQINVSELQIVAARPTASYFDIRYTKGLDSIYIDDDDAGIHFNFLSETNSLRLYKPEFLQFNDSLQAIIYVQDSLKNSLIDTLYVKFQESSRKKPPFSHNLLPSGKEIDPEQQYIFEFSKPVSVLDTSLVHFVKDSTLSYPIDSTFRFNHNRTKLILDHFIDTTTYFQHQLEILAAQDTMAVDTTSEASAKPPKRPTKSITLKAEKGAFISIENDTLDLIEKNYSFKDLKKTGEIILNISTSYTSYFIQLIDKKFDVVQDFNDTNSQVRLRRIPAGEYGIRILIDENQDGKWTQGNFTTDIEPEPIYIYPEFTSLRANWDITLNISF